jgi:hypothetical protein
MEAPAPTRDRLSTELRFILDECEVGPQVQDALAVIGVKSTSLFTNLVDDRQQIRDGLAGELGVRLVDGATAEQKTKHRVEVARIIDAWETSRKRLEESTRVQAERRALRLPNTLPAGEFLALRRQFEVQFGRREDSRFPSVTFVERKIQEVEEENLGADPLDCVMSVEETELAPLTAVLDQSGAVRVRATSKNKGELPVGPESYRRKLDLLSICYVLLKQKFPARPKLAALTTETFRLHAEHILGDEVAALRLPNNSLAPWSLVLQYDYKSRCWAHRKMHYDGLDLEAATKASWKDGDLRQQWWTTALALHCASAGRNRPDLGTKRIKELAPKEPAETETEKKIKPSKVIKPEKKAMKGICRGFNTAGGCAYGDKCRFKHVCNACQKGHPVMQCNKKKREPAKPDAADQLQLEDVP